jgi:hypothetical protein
MSTEEDTRICTVATCLGRHYGQGFCTKHYFRWRRHGNPYVIREARCSTCTKARAITNREYDTETERATDLYLLFKTGSDFRLDDRDEEGREYDFEDSLRKIR